MTEILNEASQVRHTDGTLEIMVTRGGVVGSVLLPPNTWTEDTIDSDISIRIAQENI